LPGDALASFKTDDDACAGCNGAFVPRICRWTTAWNRLKTS